MSRPSQEYFDRLDRVFKEAVDLPAGERREAFLKMSSDGAPDLIRDVCRLLERDLVIQQTGTSSAQALPRFGAYRARELIGRGGMGTVYRATREDGEVDLAVAVKSISSPIWSSLLDERFRRERQILAQLRHPNIAAFLDGGAGDDGLPFLVMELVVGEPIDCYCDSRRLPIRRRLQIFLKVCAGVEFAHRQLIVHRDIKPGNILVSPSGEPKLLDFGLARSTEFTTPQADNPTLFFTPLYSSPEVLRGRPAAVTDDVFSLGVLLYRLLIDGRPYLSEGSTPAEIVESVLHSEPRKPSTVVRGMSPVEASAVGQARGESVSSLRRSLEGDLDAIALKSVASAVTDRYSSVAELAADVSCFLDGRAVRAVAGGTFYRARKFAARHKAPVAAVLLILLSLTAGVVATLREAREAGRQRAAAERRFKEARDLTRYMMFELQTSIQKLPGSTPIKADMVRHSLSYLDRIAAEKGNDDSLRVDVAEGYSELADVLGHPLRPNLGQAGEARSLYAKAIDLLVPAVDRNPQDRRLRLALARARLMLGLCLTFYRQWDEGRKLVESAQRDLVQMLNSTPSNFDILKQTAVAFEFLAITIGQRDGYITGGSEDAVTDLQRSVELAKSALSLKPGDAETAAQLASSYNRLALLTQTHNRPGADAYFAQALATLDGLSADERSTTSIRNRRSAVLLGMGWNLGSMGNFDRGIAAINEARTTMEQLAHEDPQNRSYPLARASIYRNLGVIEDYAGHTADALTAYITAASIFETMLSADSNNPYARTSVADLRANAALLSVRLGRRKEALELARAGLPVLKQTALQTDASAAELNLAARFLTQKELPEFCDAHLGLQFAMRANTAAAGKDYVVLETLGQAYWINGDRENAVHSIEQALSLIEAPTAGKEPSRVRRNYEATLRGYRADPLADGCPLASAQPPVRSSRALRRARSSAP